MKRLSVLILILLGFLVGCTTNLPADTPLSIKGKVTIKTGEVTLLSANQENIIWESMDDAIATVDQTGPC
jgi:hypothetical protein